MRPARSITPDAGASRAPVAWGFLVGLAALRLALYLLASGPLAYGYMSDELYYLDCAERLAWGYVDHPPLSLGLLRLVRETLGDSLLALRLAPALAGCGTLILTALLARELGGERTAQGLAALAALAAPVLLAVTGFYSMNAFEPLLWSAAALLVARIVNGADPRCWLLLGAVLGLGLLNKISTLWFGLGLGVGLVLTPERRWLATPWPWLAGAIALALFAPHLLWQVQHDWPTAEFMRNATTRKMVEKSPLAFAASQLLALHPVIAPLWIAGLLYLLLGPEGRRHRLLAWIWLTVFGLLAASGTARTYYLAPAYPPLLAAGAVACERLARAPRWRWLPPVTAAVFALTGAASAPFAIPLLPPERFVAYQRALGVSAPREQVDELGALPLHFALRFGWPELLGALGEAHARLSPAEREQAVILGSWFGDTGAVNLLGAEDGLPSAISGHNNYWLWGPGGATGEVLLALAQSDEKLQGWYEDVERVAEIDCDYCMPDVARLAVYACRRPRRPMAEWWPAVKRFE
jgi:4-amino-4-deoxy-L-arabinose transferase-like glycosyltransferase